MGFREFWIACSRPRQSSESRRAGNPTRAGGEFNDTRPRLTFYPQLVRRNHAHQQDLIGGRRPAQVGEADHLRRDAVLNRCKRRGSRSRDVAARRNSGDIVAKRDHGNGWVDVVRHESGAASFIRGHTLGSGGKLRRPPVSGDCARNIEIDDAADGRRGARYELRPLQSAEERAELRLQACRKEAHRANVVVRFIEISPGFQEWHRRALGVPRSEVDRRRDAAGDGDLFSRRHRNRNGNVARRRSDGAVDARAAFKRWVRHLSVERSLDFRRRRIDMVEKKIDSAAHLKAQRQFLVGRALDAIYVLSVGFHHDVRQRHIARCEQRPLARNQAGQPKIRVIGRHHMGAWVDVSLRNDRGNLTHRHRRHRERRRCSARWR